MLPGGAPGMSAELIRLSVKVAFDV